MKKLLYFTNSYPYGVGVNWKFYELIFLKDHFDEIHVIPFGYGNNRNNPKPFIEGVFYHKPLFSDRDFFFNKRKAIFSFVKSPYKFLYLKEFVKHKVYLKKCNIISWLHAVQIMEKLRKHPFISKNILDDSDPKILYFFWARKTSLIISILKHTKHVVIAKFHGYDLYAYRYKGHYLPFQELQVKNLTKAITISRDGKNYLSKAYPAFEKKIHYVPLGTVSQGLSQMSQDGTFRLVSCSNVIPVKRVCLILEALKLIKNYQVEWVHIGDGSELNDLKERKKSIANQNIEVVFLGKLEPNKVVEYYVMNSCDLFINVSESEGVPVSIMEAMAAGIPVMATDVGGTNEIVNNKNGVLLEADITPVDIANKLIDFIELEEYKKIEMRKCAYNTYDTIYNVKKNNLKLLNLIRT